MADETPAIFGTRLKAARLHHDLTLEQASKSVGVTITTWFNAERGVRSRQANRAKLGEWLERHEPAVHVQQRTKPITSVGALLQAVLAAQNITQAHAATLLGVTEKHLSRIAVGAASLSYKLAIGLEAVTGVPAAVWNAAEAAYQDGLLRKSANADA